MATTKQVIKGLDCWITVEPFIVLNQQRTQAVDTGRYVSWFSFAEPGIYNGRPVLNSDGSLAVFDTYQAAFDAAVWVAHASIQP